MKIKLNNVSKDIKKINILRDISLELNSGVISGLKGVNGSGKTMLMRLLCGLIKPTKGEVIIDDKVLQSDISFPKNIGILIENPAFLDPYTGFQNLNMLAKMRNVIGKKEIEEVLKLVGLDNCGKKKYKHYSLGMKQRLGVAAAIMEKPEIILLDEPTNAMDSAGVQMVKDILINEKNRGALIVLACHDYSVLSELSDEIFHFEEGVLVEYERLNKE